MSFKIATIGCGGMATAAHGPSYAKYAATHPDTELAACCDLDADRAARFRDRFGFQRSYTDLGVMLDTERPDAVCLVAPVEATCTLTCDILARGYPLLMEKPPGRTLEEIDRMIAAADASGMVTQVAFNRRYTPLLRELKRLLTEQFQPSDLQHIRYDFTRVGRRDEDFSTTAIHGIDAARFLAGSDYATIQFHYREYPQFGPGVANIFMDCVFASGATAHLGFCPMTGAVVERATIHAWDHTFYLDLPLSNSLDLPGRLQHIEKDKRQQDVTGEEISDGSEMFELNGFYAENAAFFDAIRSGVTPEGDLRSARQSVEVAQCVRERRSMFKEEA
jgi:predicted dehydrogenase